MSETQNDQQNQQNRTSAQVWAELGELIGNGLPAPTSIIVNAYSVRGYVGDLAELDAWADALGLPREHIVEEWWSNHGLHQEQHAIRVQGAWRGRDTSMAVVETRPLPPAPPVEMMPAGLGVPDELAVAEGQDDAAGETVPDGEPELRLAS